MAAVSVLVPSAIARNKAWLIQMPCAQAFSSCNCPLITTSVLRPSMAQESASVCTSLILTSLMNSPHTLYSVMCATHEVIISLASPCRNPSCWSCVTPLEETPPSPFPLWHRSADQTRKVQLQPLIAFSLDPHTDCAVISDARCVRLALFLLPCFRFAFSLSCPLQALIVSSGKVYVWAKHHYIICTMMSLYLFTFNCI